MIKDYKMHTVQGLAEQVTFNWKKALDHLDTLSTVNQILKITNLAETIKQ